jgi:hypothetical protein
MTIPRGTEEGMKFKLFFMISKLLPDDDALKGNWEKLNTQPWTWCGVLTNGTVSYPDSRPAGFPLDRPPSCIDGTAVPEGNCIPGSWETLLKDEKGQERKNMKVADLKIYHNSLPMPREQGFLEVEIWSPKPGKSAQFFRARSSLLSLLRSKTGLLADREFLATEGVIKGKVLSAISRESISVFMANYASKKAYDAIITPDIVASFERFMQTAYRYVAYFSKTKNPEFDLDTIANDPDSVLSINIVRPKAGKELEYIKLKEEALKRIDSSVRTVSVTSFLVTRDAITGESTNNEIDMWLTLYRNDQIRKNPELAKLDDGNDPSRKKLFSEFQTTYHCISCLLTKNIPDEDRFIPEVNDNENLVSIYVFRPKRALEEVFLKKSSSFSALIRSKPGLIGDAEFSVLSGIYENFEAPTDLDNYGNEGNIGVRVLMETFATEEDFLDTWAMQDVQEAYPFYEATIDLQVSAYAHPKDPNFDMNLFNDPMGIVDYYIVYAKPGHEQRCKDLKELYIASARGSDYVLTVVEFDVHGYLGDSYSTYSVSSQQELQMWAAVFQSQEARKNFHVAIPITDHCTCVACMIMTGLSDDERFLPVDRVLMEVSARTPKRGMVEQFIQQRSKYISLLMTKPGIFDTREFNNSISEISANLITANYDDYNEGSDINVLMTNYDNKQAFDRLLEDPELSAASPSFFATLDLLTSVLAYPKQLRFDLRHIGRDNQVLGINIVHPTHLEQYLKQKSNAMESIRSSSKVMDVFTFDVMISPWDPKKDELKDMWLVLYRTKEDSDEALSDPTLRELLENFTATYQCVMCTVTADVPDMDRFLHGHP